MTRLVVSTLINHCEILVTATTFVCAFIVIVNQEISWFAQLSQCQKLRERNKTMEGILLDVTADSVNSDHVECLVNRYGLPIAQSNHSFFYYRKWCQYLTHPQRLAVIGGPSKLPVACFYHVPYYIQHYSSFVHCMVFGGLVSQGDFTC